MAEALPDHLVEEVLLRLPPAEPACLARATVVCRHWRRLISDQSFRRRFRELHRNPPTLGFLRRVFGDGVHGIHFFLPAAASSSFRPPHADEDVPTDWMAVDARHGRVLFRDFSASRSCYPGGIRNEFVVSSPMTGDVWMVPKLLLPLWWYAGWQKDSVLCAAAAGGCDHLDCHRGPFAVVTTDAWRTASSIHHTIGHVVPWAWRAAFAGNALYFLFFLESSETCRILEYNLGKEELSLIDLPLSPAKATSSLALLVENSDRLEIAAVVQHNKIYMWSRDTTQQDGWRWAKDRVIDLEGLLPVAISAASTSPHILAFVDGVDVVSVWIPSVGVFNLHIVSGLATKIGDIDGYTSFHPYKSFYVPRFLAYYSFDSE
ncbi:hypothetical protein BS78_02G014400 [Paspalum vaginatum]|nr:hypothetical protein BS78_02G014400 [Paspalum vaginatum]